MSSPAKETPEEKKLRISRFRELASLANRVRELINKLKKLMKSGVTLENQSLFLESASALHSKLTEIHGCGLPGQEACFNEALKNVTDEMRETCNLQFELFPGPEEEARAKVDEAHRALEEKEMLVKKSIDASLRRQQLGFTQHELENLPPWLNLLILRFLTTPRPDAVEAFQYPKRRKMTECERICEVLCDNSKFSEFIADLYGSWDEKLQSRRMCGRMKDARKCMQSNSDCSTCIIFSIACQIVHGLNCADKTKVCCSPSINLNHVLLVAGMSRFDRYAPLFLNAYLFFIGSDFWQEKVRTTTIPNIRDAITNPECAFKEELVDSLTDYVRRYRKDQIEMVDDLYKSLFENWRKWYTSNESDSSFHPYSFLTMPKFP